MSDAVLNQLLEDAAVKATELASHAEAGAVAATSVAKHAQTLGSQAVDAAKSLHAQYEQAIAAVKHAAEHSHGAADDARGSLANVPDAAMQVGATAADLFESLHTELGELAAMRGGQLKEVATSAGDTEQEFHLLAQEVQELSNRLDGGLRQTAVHLEALRLALEKTGTEIEASRGAIGERLRALGESATTFTTEVGLDIGQVLGTMSRGALAVCNAAVHGVNTLAAATRSGILDETAARSEPPKNRT